MNFLTIVIISALLATIVSLVIGLGFMGKGGEADEEHSTQLMFARVGFQALTFVLLLLALYLASD